MTQMKSLPLLILLPLACAGCSVVDRAGQDLETAGSNIAHPGTWLRHEFGGSTETRPVMEGHSPDVDYSVGTTGPSPPP